jgi:hypothetical protein
MLFVKFPPWGTRKKLQAWVCSNLVLKKSRGKKAKKMASAETPSRYVKLISQEGHVVRPQIDSVPFGTSIHVLFRTKLC